MYAKHSTLNFDVCHVIFVPSSVGTSLLTAESAQKTFVAVFADVVLPITLTSLTNLCMFAILATAALPAVYLTALTAAMAVVLLYATVLTSFAAAVALDFQRQVAQRYDVLCCRIAPLTALNAPSATAIATEVAALEAKKDKPSSNSGAPSSAHALANTRLKELLWKQVYKPLLQSRFGRVAVLAVALALLVLASVGLANLKLGLGLTEFFPVGSQVLMRTYLT